MTQNEDGKNQTTVSDSANDSSQNINTEIFEQLRLELREFKKEIEFAASNLSGKSNEIGGTLNRSLTKFEQSNARLELLFKDHTEANQNFEKKISILTLLPEKLSIRIKDMVPDIAEALDTRVTQNMEVMKAQFDSLNQEMALRVNEQQERISQVTTKLIERSSSAVENSQRVFLIRLLITAIFTIGTSALTSYLVTVKYPRFIEITGAHDIKVQNSDVKIWGQVKDSNRAEEKR